MGREGLTYSWIEFYILFKCCLIEITMIIQRHLLYLVYLCLCPGLSLIMSYLRDLFFVFSRIFIAVNRITSFNGPLSVLRQLLKIENPVEIIKNAFWFMLKTLCVFQIFTFVSWPYGYVEKRLDKRAIVIFKNYDVTGWTTKNYNIRITQYIKK